MSTPLCAPVCGLWLLVFRNGASVISPMFHVNFMAISSVEVGIYVLQIGGFVAKSVDRRVPSIRRPAPNPILSHSHHPHPRPTPPCTALHCTALHCTALHCTALHCTHVPCLPALHHQVYCLLSTVLVWPHSNNLSKCYHFQCLALDDFSPEIGSGDPW
jgi:hypothetical protein